MQPFDDLSPAEMDPRNEKVIGFLRQVHGGPEPEPEQQTLALARVRQRLLEAQPEQFAPDVSASSQADLHLTEVDEGFAPSPQKSAGFVRESGWSRRFSAIAAALAAALIVASMLAVFSLAKRGESVAPGSSTPSTSAIYALSGGWLQKIDTQEGRLLWKYQVSTNEPSSLLAVSNNIAVIATHQNLVALSVSDGTLLWSNNLDGQVAVRPVIANNRVYILLWKDMPQYDNHGSLETFDAQSGHLLWHYDGPLFPAFAVTNNMVYGGLDFSQATSNGLVPDFDRFALSAVDGSEQWHVHHDPSVTSAPVNISAADGQVYMEATPENGDESISAYNASSGTFLWRSSALRDLYQMGPLLVAQNTLYLSFQKGLSALNEQNGQLLWSHSSQGSAGVSFALKDGKIFGTERDGNSDSLIELDASSGKLVAQHPIESSIVPSNGAKSADLVSGSTTYVISTGSHLDAFDNQTGVRLWSTPVIEAQPGVDLVLVSIPNRS